MRSEQARTLPAEMAALGLLPQQVARVSMPGKHG